MSADNLSGSQQNLFIIKPIIGSPPLLPGQKHAPATVNFYSAKLYQFPGRMNHIVSIKIPP